jgi:NAD(P)-dependent dehydrogenase (short-subunit alcohol dehydrogenase family)
MVKNIVITGGAKGIGSAVAEVYCTSGDRVFVLDREPAEMPGESAMRGIVCDVADPVALGSAVEQLSLECGHIDVLINNAGSYEPRSFLEMDLEDWEKGLRDNLTPAFLTTRACLALLRPGSVVINVSSSLGEIPEPEALVYSVAKAGVNMLTRGLALDLAPCGVRVLAVAPGPITSGAEGSFEVCQITGENLAALNPMGRFGTVEEVAALIQFLSSDKAGYMTGSVIHQNGGENAMPAAWSGLRRVRETGAITGAQRLQQITKCTPSDRVRESCTRVMERAQHIQIDGGALESFMQSISVEDVKQTYRWEAEFHPIGERGSLIDFVFSIDAINFGCGFSPDWKRHRKAGTYATVAQALTDLQESGVELGASFAASVTDQQVAEMLGVEESFSLVSMFGKALRSLGRFVYTNFGTYQEFLESLSPSGAAQNLVQQLVEHVGEFNDCCLYRGEVVYFYKRAQILVNDLHLALGNDSPFIEDEVASLTMFADNLVPHVFLCEKVLQYDERLLDTILLGNPLGIASAEEVEIRAAGVVAVERGAQILSELSGKRIYPAMLDVYLWNQGQDVRYKSRPRHLTKTYYY